MPTYTSTRIEVSGIGAARKHANQFRNIDKELRAAGKEAGEILIAEIRRTAKFSNRAHRPSSGRLLRTLRTVSITKGAAVRLGNARVPYAGPIHFGWAYDKEWLIRKNIAPNPFMYRAFGWKKQDILDAYKKQVDKLI
jgi:hypothetical protein